MAQLFEAFMVMCFGVSWPLSIYKSLTSRSNKGKSLIFLLFILFGYGFGIISKLISGKITYVFFFYVLNFVMVFVDGLVYLRNRQLEKPSVPGPA
ncbi:MAG: hypothetical protein VB108_08885 [Anaerolineaceae bacterium]|nr:hypothetical protein [Anaerolineaceae bacterium]